MKYQAAVLLTALGAWAAWTSPAAAAPDPKLAQQGYEFLNKYCARCHGIDFKVPKLNVLDRDILLAKNKDGDPYLTPGQPDKSQLWQRVGVDKDMPKGLKKPKPQEIDLLKKWIEAGAPFPGAEEKRTFKGETDILRAVQNHLRKKVHQEDRRFQRYFTLTHLYNNPSVSAEKLRLYQAALAKLVNSLSWESELVIPQAVDKEGTIFRVDLRDLGWDRHDLWREILKAYPYALAYDDSQDRVRRDLAREVYDMTGCSVPYLRADWFVATASRPPLYHTMLQLPTNARVLERRLHVDVEKNFLRDRLARAGLITSGVSKQNRLVERHPASGGSTYYWKSYDFATNKDRGNLKRFPLGPVFGSPRLANYRNQAFEHAGGEIIFNLPNGLQGYMLVNNQDERIDKGPINIVSDHDEWSGTPEIVNGLSCMACHKHGMLPCKDTLREGNAVFGEARLKVERLFPPAERMNRWLKKDEARFMAAAEECTTPFLKVGPDAGKGIRDFPEPVSAIAKQYIKNLTLEEVAFELGYPDAKELKVLIKNNSRLKALGMRPLLSNQLMDRESWESLKETYSLYQKVALELELGGPYRVRE
jgi:serine/threonine-protein kinase